LVSGTLDGMEPSLISDYGISTSKFVAQSAKNFPQQATFLNNLS
jgi:hypothetical protein